MGKKTVLCRGKDKVGFILTYSWPKPNQTNIESLSMDWYFPVVECYVVTCVRARSYVLRAGLACVSRPSTAVSKTMAMENLGYN